MIYVDTSVVLAHLLSEDRSPPATLWEQDLVASRLLEYEVWHRLHGMGLAASHGDAARLTLARLGFLEMDPRVLERALLPFPLPVRTLDALHLASAAFLRERGHEVTLATYDTRMVEVAGTMGLPLFPL